MVEMAGGGWEKLKKGKKGRTVEMNKNTSSLKKESDSCFEENNEKPKDFLFLTSFSAFFLWRCIHFDGDPKTFHCLCMVDLEYVWIFSLE